LLENNLTAKDWTALLNQSYIEHLWDDDGYAVHESTRNLLLAKLYQDNAQLYRELNRRAAKYCEQQNQDELRWKLATLYHQVLADFAIEYQLNNQAIDWFSNSQRNGIEALISSLSEEIKEKRVNDSVTTETYFWKNLTRMYHEIADKHLSLEECDKREENNLKIAITCYLKMLKLYRRIDGKIGEQANCLQRLGDAHLRLSELKVAQERYKQALSLFQQIDDKLGKANCIKSLGDVYLRLSELKVAQEQYEQASLLFQQIGDKPGEADCTASLGDVYLRLSDYEAAREAYQQALPLFQQIGNKLGEANCIKSIGDIYLDLSELEVARKQYKQALPLFQQIEANLDEASCISCLGDVHLRLSDYESARETYQQALLLFQQIGDEFGKANCTASLGDVYLRLSDYEAARTAYQQALPLFQQIGNKLGEANCMRSLGDVYLNLSELESAQNTYQQALILFQQSGSKLGEANCIRRLGQILAEQEHIELAIQIVKQAAELYRTIGLIVDEARCFDKIANVYHDQKRYEESLAAYQQAIAIAPEGGTWYHNRADTYIAMEKYDLALQDIERAEKTGTYLEYLQKHRGMIALWQQQPQTAVELLQHATQQRPKDGSFQCALALALLANGNAEAFATMETGLKLTYRKKSVENLLEDLDKLVRIYGERGEFAQMRTLLTQELMQRSEMPSEPASS